MITILVTLKRQFCLVSMNLVGIYSVMFLLCCCVSRREPDCQLLQGDLFPLPVKC